MKTFSRLFVVLLGLLLVSGPELAGAQGMVGTSMGSGGGLSMGAANGTFLRLDGTNTMAAALTSSNGTFRTSGDVALVLESTLANTAGVETAIVLRSSVNLTAADKLVSLRDAGATEQLYVAADGSVVPATTAASTLGTSGLRFSSAFVGSLYASGYVYPLGISDSAALTVRIGLTATSSNTYTATIADGAASVAHVFDTANTMTTTAKLASFKNATVEKVYVSATGRVVAAADVTAEGSTKLGGTTNGYGVTGGTTVYPLELMAQMNDGATAIGVQVNTNQAYANAGAKLFSVKNNGTEKLSVSQTGAITSQGTILTGSAIYGGSFQPGGTTLLSLISSTSTAGATNAKGYSAANAAGEYAWVFGTSDTTTAQIDFAVANDVDGTPLYVFEVDGLGNTAIGGSLPAGQASRLYMGGTITPAAGAAYGANILPTFDPPNGSGASVVAISPMITATAAETNPSFSGLAIDGFTKFSTGTVTTVYGLFVGTSTVGTNNISISTTGIVQFGRVSSATPTEPAACSVIYNGSQVFVDDTNDGVPGFMCICGTGSDDSTYAWSKMNTNPASACF